MAFNRASELIKRYQEQYDCCKTGSIGVRGDIERLETFLKDILEDEEKLKDFDGGLNAFGTSIEVAKEKIEALKTIQKAIELVYPSPEPEEGP